MSVISWSGNESPSEPSARISTSAPRCGPPEATGAATAAAGGGAIDALMVCPQLPQNLKLRLFEVPHLGQMSCSLPAAATCWEAELGAGGAAIGIGAGAAGAPPKDGIGGAAMGIGAGAAGAPPKDGMGGAAMGIGAGAAGAPPKDGMGGAAMAGMAGPGARPAAGVGAVKLLGACAASRGSSAPQPRQNL